MLLRKISSNSVLIVFGTPWFFPNAARASLMLSLSFFPLHKNSIFVVIWRASAFSRPSNILNPIIGRSVHVLRRQQAWFFRKGRCEIANAFDVLDDADRRVIMPRNWKHQTIGIRLSVFSESAQFSCQLKVARRFRYMMSRSERGAICLASSATDSDISSREIVSKIVAT